jgi:hypothetical protein
VATVITIKTIYDEVIAALNFNTNTDSAYRSAVATADTYLTEAYIGRLTAQNIIGSESTFNAELRGADFDFGAAAPDLFQLYYSDGRRRYDYWLSPSFTTQTDVNYTLNASGSIEVTTDGTRDSRSTITVSAVPVNFAMLMVDIFRILGNHFSREASESMGAVSSGVATVRKEIMNQASHWASENYLYG